MQMFWRSEHNYLKTLSGANFREIVEDLFYNLIQLEEGDANHIIKALQSDIGFLCRHRVSHYALLLVVERMNSVDDERISVRKLPKKRKMDDVIARRADFMSDDRDMNRRMSMSNMTGSVYSHNSYLKG